MTPYLQTYSGLNLHVTEPEPEQICIEDIARGLSRACRFNGQAHDFYSVAQHCVLAFRWAEMTEELDIYHKQVPDILLQILLHDAAEAYLGDVPTPLKIHLPHFCQIEEKLLQTIFKKYDLPTAFHPIVYEVDTRMLFTEKRDLMNHQKDWKTPIKEPYTYPIIPWSENRAYIEFMTAFHIATILKEASDAFYTSQAE